MKKEIADKVFTEHRIRTAREAMLERQANLAFENLAEADYDAKKLPDLDKAIEDKEAELKKAETEATRIEGEKTAISEERSKLEKHDPRREELKTKLQALDEQLEAARAKANGLAGQKGQLNKIRSQVQQRIQQRKNAAEVAVDRAHHFETYTLEYPADADEEDDDDELADDEDYRAECC